MMALVWLLQSTSAQGALGARPIECRMHDGGRTANAWERAKEPNLRRYCDLLASGTAKLVGPGSLLLVEEIPRIADQADQLLPGRAAPSVLKGRGLLRLGKAEEALAALSEAKRRDERALDDPLALLAWARANARTGHLSAAARAYRAALPRTSLLPGTERAAAAFEAGMVVMAEGLSGIDDAAAMFRESRRDSEGAMHDASVLALALALDRSARKEEARAVLAERARTDAKAIVSDARVMEALADAGVRHEADALVGLALDGVEGSSAKDAWQKYLDGPGAKGPWTDHAREHAGRAPPKKNVPARGGVR